VVLIFRAIGVDLGTHHESTVLQLPRAHSARQYRWNPENMHNPRRGKHAMPGAIALASRPSFFTCRGELAIQRARDAEQRWIGNWQDLFRADQRTLDALRATQAEPHTTTESVVLPHVVGTLSTFPST
jgi:hypothetical protein